MYFQSILGYQQSEAFQIYPSYVSGKTTDEEEFDNFGMAFTSGDTKHIKIESLMKGIHQQRQSKKRESMGDKAHACSYPGCFYAYAQKKNLRRHEVSVHGRVPKRTGRWHPEMRQTIQADNIAMGEQSIQADSIAMGEQTIQADNIAMGEQTPQGQTDHGVVEDKKPFPN